MNETLYKGVRPDGRDFYSGTVQWAPEKMKARKGCIVKHPTSTTGKLGDFTTFLSVSTDPMNLPGSSWPLRLLEVEPVGDLLRVDACKRGGTSFRVIREVDPSLHFGPMGAYVVALIDRATQLTADDVRNLHAARYTAEDAAWYATWYTAEDAARAAARAATWYAAWAAAWDAARAAAEAAARAAAWDAARAAARYAAWAAARYATWYTAEDAARYTAEDAARAAAEAAVVHDLISQGGFTQEQYDLLTDPWRKVIGPIHPDDEDLRDEAR